MQDLSTSQVMVAVGCSPLIQAIDRAARDLAGVRILFMLRQRDDIVKLSPDGSEANLPEFCHLLRASRAGLRRCAACRALVGFGACYRGLTEYCCHGGVHVIAAAARTASGEASRAIVVSSSALAAADRGAGWAAILAHEKGQTGNLRGLHRAYARLPPLTAANQAIVEALVQIAATAVGEIEHTLALTRGEGPSAAVVPENAAETGPQGRLTAALFVSRDRPPGDPRTGRGAVLADLVADLVSRDPGMPFTVAGVAAAAHLTPNHFSMLFRKHTGHTFQEFLTARRIAHAKLLLRDLSLNIAEIAQQAGFADAGYFARRFRKQTGMTPRQWREAL